MKVQLHHRVPNRVCFTLYYKSLSQQLQASTEPTQSCRGTDKLFAILERLVAKEPPPARAHLHDKHHSWESQTRWITNVKGNHLSRERCAVNLLQMTSLWLMPMAMASGSCRLPESMTLDLQDWKHTNSKAITKVITGHQNQNYVS